MWTVPGAYTGTIAIEIAKAKHYNMCYLLLRERLRWRLWLRRWRRRWQLRLQRLWLRVWRYWLPLYGTPRRLEASALGRFKS